MLYRTRKRDTTPDLMDMLEQVRNGQIFEPEQDDDPVTYTVDESRTRSTDEEDEG